MDDSLSNQEQINCETVREYGLDIKDIKNPSVAVQLIATSQNGRAIQYIENPTESVQFSATSQNGYCIRYIKNPSESVQLNAIANNLYAISLIKSPTEAVQLNAMLNDVRVLKLLSTPAISVVLKAIRTSPKILFDSSFSQQLTPIMLEKIHTGLANQVSMIKSLSNDESERVAMLSEMLQILAEPSSVQIATLDLPFDIKF
jgi:hypothetical protein